MRVSRPIVVVILLLAALAVYFVLLGVRAIELIRAGGFIAIGLGVGVLLLPLIGIVLVVFELRFGMATTRLARQLRPEEAAGLADPDELPRRPSGRVDRDAADAYFARVRERVEADPQNWRGWYSLGVAYDLAGDRKRARAAMRTAIDLAFPR